MLDEVFPVCKTITEKFINSIDETGLIPKFPYPFWNFYEWAEESDNECEIERKNNKNYKKEYDLLLNTFFLWSLRYYEKLCNYKNVPFHFNYDNFADKIRIKFYKNGKYVLHDNTNLSSELGNSMVYLAGVDNNEKIIRDIMSSTCEVKATLSMLGFVYDAVLKYDEKNREFVLNDIRKKYQYMIDCGATACWETVLGAKDFLGAGSLCHGWSAMPIYYLNKLF